MNLVEKYFVLVPLSQYGNEGFVEKFVLQVAGAITERVLMSQLRITQKPIAFQGRKQQIVCT